MDDSFRLSRIYCQGWNAAKKLLAGGDSPGGAQSAKLNPYNGDEERCRWAKGFEEASASRAGAHNFAAARAWHRTSKR